MKGFLFACLAASSLCTVARAGPMCVPQDQIATHGVRLGDSEATVRKLLGKPRKISSGTAEDDGGKYSTTTMDYGSLAVTMGHDRVESIAISGNHHPVAAGLAIGGSPDRLQSKALIDNTDLVHGAAFNIRFCGDEKLDSAGLSIFVEHGRVTKAVLYAYGP